MDINEFAITVGTTTVVIGYGVAAFTAIINIVRSGKLPSFGFIAKAITYPIFTGLSTTFIIKLCQYIANNPEVQTQMINAINKYNQETDEQKQIKDYQNWSDNNKKNSNERHNNLLRSEHQRYNAGLGPRPTSTVRY